MSVAAVAWALEQNTGDATAKLILISLADHHNASTKECFPHKETLAKAGMCSLATVKRKLALLVSDEWVKTVRKYGKGGRHCRNFYEINFLKKSVAQSEPPTPLDASGGGSPAEPHEGVTLLTHLNLKNNKKEKARAPEREASETHSLPTETRTAAKAAGSPDAGEGQDETRTSASEALGSPAPGRQKGASRVAVSSTSKLDDVIEYGAFAGMTYREANARQARPRGREYA